MKTLSPKKFKEREAYLKEKLGLEQDRLELKVKEIQFEFLGRGLNILKSFFSSK